MDWFSVGFLQKGKRGMLTKSGRTLGQVRLEGGLLLAALTAFCCQTRQQCFFLVQANIWQFLDLS